MDQTVYELQTPNGNTYSIEFSHFSTLNSLIPFISVSIVLIEQITRNEIKDIFSLANEIEKYILANDVILFYVCSEDDDIYIRSNDKTPKEFRKKIFSFLTHRKNSGKYFNMNLEKGYLSIFFITRNVNKTYLNDFLLNEAGFLDKN